ncbi:unnamed protein product [Choristocarpus tenellus]
MAMAVACAFDATLLKLSQALSVIRVPTRGPSSAERLIELAACCAPFLDAYEIVAETVLDALYNSADNDEQRNGENVQEGGGAWYEPKRGAAYAGAWCGARGLEAIPMDRDISAGHNKSRNERKNGGSGSSFDFTWEGRLQQTLEVLGEGVMHHTTCSRENKCCCLGRGGEKGNGVSLKWNISFDCNHHGRLSAWSATSPPGRETHPRVCFEGIMILHTP